MSLSCFEDRLGKHYIAMDRTLMQWNLYDDPDGKNLIMLNVYIESYIADPGAKFYPVDSEDRLEMCERLHQGIEASERRLKRYIEGAKLAKTAKDIYGGYGP